MEQYYPFMEKSLDIEENQMLDQNPKNMTYFYGNRLVLLNLNDSKGDRIFFSHFPT